MNILAVIPARGRSKRLPGKNIRPLAGKPLIAWSIDTAREVAEIREIVVSTDDPAIREVALQCGASVPWLRPAHLASDTARTADVVLHTLDWYESQAAAPDGVLLLQPTSPFRTAASIHEAFELFRRHDRRAVVAVSPVRDHPAWTLSIENGRLAPLLDNGGGLETRSQDLAPCFTVNGSLYLVSPADLRCSRSFSAAGATPLIVESPKQALDIDTLADWQLAEFFATRTDGVVINEA